MSVDVAAEILIAKPTTTVADYAMDPTNDPTWIGGVKQAKTLTDPPLGAGSRVARVAGFLGRRFEYVNEVVEFDSGRRLAMRSVTGPFPMRITYEFDEPSPGRTRVRLRVQGDATGFFRLAAPVLAAAVRRSVRGDLRRLKRAVESRDSASPAT